jgi:transketolase C-terminal domain/subunit
VAGALAGSPGVIVKSLAVQELPRSGAKDYLMDLFGINARHIQEAVKEMLA